MELCQTCKRNNCNKTISIIQEEKTLTIKCFDYEKDKEKIKGYVKPKERTAKLEKTLMGLSSSSWS